MASLNQELITTCLLGILLLVLGALLAMVFMVLHWKRLKMRSPSADSATDLPQVRRSPGRYNMGFGTRNQNCWLAVRQSDLRAVQAALALHDTKPCSWSEGISGEGGHTLFISPPVSGWILVMGHGLPDPADDVDVCFRFLTGISRKLGHVQFFAVNHALDQHAWASLEGGRVLRAYAWAGRTLWNEGKPTQAEGHLRMKCHPYGEPAGDRSFAGSEAMALNADKIHLLAARWSLDPNEIDESFIEHEWGIVGESSPRF